MTAAQHVDAFASAHKLTPRQTELVCALAHGFTRTADIAAHMGTARRTVENQLRKIFDRTETHSKTEILQKLYASQNQPTQPGVRTMQRNDIATTPEMEMWRATFLKVLELEALRVEREQSAVTAQAIATADDAAEAFQLRFQPPPAPADDAERIAQEQTLSREMFTPRRFTRPGK